MLHAVLRYLYANLYISGIRDRTYRAMTYSDVCQRGWSVTWSGENWGAVVWSYVRDR